MAATPEEWRMIQEDKGAAAKKKAGQALQEKPEYEDMEVPLHWQPLTLFLVSLTCRCTLPSFACAGMIVAEQ